MVCVPQGIVFSAHETKRHCVILLRLSQKAPDCVRSDSSREVGCTRDGDFHIDMVCWLWRAESVKGESTGEGRLYMLSPYLMPLCYAGFPARFVFAFCVGTRTVLQRWVKNHNNQKNTDAKKENREQSFLELHLLDLCVSC